MCLESGKNCKKEMNKIIEQNQAWSESNSKDRMPTQINKPSEHLNWLLRIFSIDISERKITTSEKCCYVFKAACTLIIIASIEAYSFKYKMLNVYPDIDITIKATDVVHMIYDWSQYFVDLFYTYKYGKDISIEYYLQYETFDNTLGMVYYTDIKKRISKLIWLFAFIWISNSSFDFFAWERSYGWIVPTVYIVAYFYCLMKILTALNLTAQILNVEYRLRTIGDLLQDCYYLTENFSETDPKKEFEKDFLWNKNWFYSRTSRSNERTIRGLKAPVRRYQIKWLSRCYLLLSEQCCFINRMFGIRIVLNSLSMLIDMVRFLNVTVRIAVGSQTTTYNSGCLPSVANTFRLLASASVLISLVLHCERAYRQRDRIIRIIDHLLVNKNPDNSLRSEVKDLRELVVSQPISFNMAHFFELNNTYLLSMASVVVTFTIILLQSS